MVFSKDFKIVDAKNAFTYKNAFIEIDGTEIYNNTAFIEIEMWIPNTTSNVLKYTTFSYFKNILKVEKTDYYPYKFKFEEDRGKYIVSDIIENIIKECTGHVLHYNIIDHDYEDFAIFRIEKMLKENNGIAHKYIDGLQLRELYLINLENKEKLHFADDPKPLFNIPEDYLDSDGPFYFDKDNWNSNQNILRHIGRIIYNEYDSNYSFILKNGYIVEIITIYDEDDWCTFVKYSNEYGFLKNIYTCAWYKNRGRTDNIMINGRTIDLDEYLFIVNVLLQDRDIRRKLIEINPDYAKFLS